MLLFVVIVILFYENIMTTNEKISFVGFNFNQKSTYISGIKGLNDLPVYGVKLP